jgi:pimeloyl-ACP methyl ester carboxylesterase
VIGREDNANDSLPCQWEERTMHSMNTVQTDDGVTLAYQTQGDGPVTLLFMHGWAGSGAFFDETITQLDLSGLRVITYDMRGHGASDQAETGYTLDRFAQDAFAVADAVGAVDLVPIGYSMSGKFAQYMALTEPDRIRGLILVSGWPASSVPFPPEMHQDWIDLAGDRERLLQFERQFLTQPVAPEVLERWLDDAVRVPRLVLDGTLTMTTQPSFDERLGDLQVPTLVVGGSDDQVATPDFMRQLVVAPLAHVGARFVLADSNHDVPIEQPRQLANLIEAFVAGMGD